MRARRPVLAKAGIKGRKRHILTDTCGYLVHALVHAADIQDRDGAPLVLAAIINRFPWLRHVFADGGYGGDKLCDALARIGKWTLEIIKRSDTAKGFELFASALGCRADIRLAQPKPSPCKRLRAQNRRRSRLALPRFRPTPNPQNSEGLTEKCGLMSQTLIRYELDLDCSMKPVSICRPSKPVFGVTE